MKTFLLCLLLSASAFAQNAKNPFLAPLKDPAFYIGTAEFAASTFADAHHTQECIKNLTCVEAYPGHETYRHQLPEIGLVVGVAYGCSLMFSDHHRWRWTCLAIPVVLSLQHWQASRTIYPGIAKP